MKKNFQNGGPAPSEDKSEQLAAVTQLLNASGFTIGHVATNYNVGGPGPDEFQTFLYLNQEYRIGVEITSSGKVALFAAMQTESETLAIERGSPLVIFNTLFFEKPELIIEFVQSLIPGKKAVPGKSRNIN